MQPHLWEFLALTFAGWGNRSQQDAVEYLKEENRVLREQLDARRLRFTDDQRRRLAAKAKALCRENLKEIAELVTPDRCLINDGFRLHSEYWHTTDDKYLYTTRG